MQKGQCLGNFKEIRFGYEDTTLADWFTRKRLLSVPRVLKAEKVNQSYIIRKAASRPYSNDLLFETVQGPKKTSTEPR